MGIENSLDTHNPVDESLDVLGLDNRPLPDPGQMLVIVGDIVLDLLCQILDGWKVPSAEDMPVKYAEPDFNGV